MMIWSDPLSNGRKMKSYALCAEAIRECLDVPGNRVLLARKESVAFKNTTLVTLLQLIPSSTVHRKVEQQFLFTNGSVLIYTGLGTEKDNEKIRGLEIGFLGIDEASEVDRNTFETAASRLRWKPAMDAKRIKVRLTSNPSPGWLKEDFIDSPRTKIVKDGDGNPVLDEFGDPIEEQMYYYIKATMRDNPHVDDEYRQQAEEIYADNPVWLEAMVNGDWDAFTGNDQVIPSYQIIDAMEHNKATIGTPTIWGLDIARKGDDSTVLFECSGSKFRQVKEWKKKGLEVWGPEILDIYKESKIKPQLINVDDIGIGGLGVDYLAMNGLPARGLNVSRVSKHNSNKYTNMKAEIWWNLRNRFKNETLEIPNDNILKTELGSVKFDYVSGRVMIPDKEKIKKNLGRSPDRADAFVLASWGGSMSFAIFDTLEELGPTMPGPVEAETFNETFDKTKTMLTNFLKRRS